MSSQAPPKPPATSSRSPPVPSSNGSTQDLGDRARLMRNTVLTLLQDTNWPARSEDTVQNLVQTINSLPDLPRDVTPLKAPTEELINVLEAAHAILEKGSEKYGGKQGGFRDRVKRAFFSLRPGKYTDILQTCRADIETVSTTLRSRLESIALIGSVEDSKLPSSLQNQPTSTPLDISRSLEPLESQGLQTSSPDQAMTLAHSTGRKASAQDSSTGVPEDQEKRNPIRGGSLTALRKTFKTVDAVSGTIPAVGSYVGAAAKVGLAVVNMIETMDKNEDVAEDLTSHTAKLSEYLEHIKTKSDAEHVHNLHRELESIQKKVSKWNSLGYFKKAFLASEYAGELKEHRYTAQNVLEEMQLLVSLKTSDLVIELENRELRAERQRLLDRLGDGNYGARGNSIEDVVCLPDTRVAILDRIDEWIKDTSTLAERVLWIRGMAGRGKSTIASTVARSWQSRGSCAIFHFRRGQNAADGQFICALARQLGKGLVPEVRKAILECVEENGDIAKERLDLQFKKLFVGSLNRLEGYAYPIIIIVDALDECENVADAIRFVRLIDEYLLLLPSHVKFLLTCRPETPLVDALEPRKWHAEDLDSVPHVLEDIATFIQHSFGQIRSNRGLPEHWPLPTDVKRMVEMSQGLFQWARTAIAYIDEKAPVERLQELLQHSSKWGKLDYLYNEILSRAFAEAENSMREQLLSWVLETLVVAPYPVSLEVIAFLHADHRIFKGQGDPIQFLRNDILAGLNSLLHIPPSPREPLRLMHTSIHDLLKSQERCKSQPYFIDVIQAHRRLANVSLGIMERDLRKNICELSDISRANSEVQDAVEGHVPKGLRYCCRSWFIHLTIGWPSSETDGPPSNDLPSLFRMVCEKKLLAWLEVMSLIGATNEALTVAQRVHQWLEKWPLEMSSNDLITLWNDTRRFIGSSVEPISFGALHIYASALPHCPTNTELWAKYGGQATTRILFGQRLRNWTAEIWQSPMREYASEISFSPDGGLLACILALEGTVQLLDAQTGASVGTLRASETEWIRFIVFSPDSKVLASASCGNALWGDRTSESTVFLLDSKILYGNAIRLWDVRTGTQLGGPWTGHTETIESIVFSPDGEVLASGSDDSTIRLWDARTGTQLGDPLTGHTDAINSVFFSPDGKVVASASDDKTIRLWDARTGARLGDPLTGHTRWITSGSFSPDGSVLATKSLDKTVRLWDARTRAQLGDPLASHTGWITSVFLSPDGKVLATELFEDTIRLWDARTGAPLGNPLTGHTGRVGTVVFSSDGKVLASGSDDDTIRLWDARTGSQLGNPLTGHTQRVGTVVFSPDGTRVASASEDKTVRLWDTRPGAPLGDSVNGHTPRIRSIIFSPNGRVLASVVDGGTIQLWDVRTGAPSGVPLAAGGTTRTGSVVFSSDGKVLASVSEGNIVQLWDARTRAQLGTFKISTSSPGIRSVVSSPGGKALAFVLSNKTVQLWDAQTQGLLGEPLIDSEGIRSVVFSPDGTVLASALYTNTVRLWDARTGAPLDDVDPPSQAVTGHTELLRFVVFSPDSNLLASVSGSTAQLWDTRTGKKLGDPLTSHTGEIASIVFLPDGTVLASGSTDKTPQLWDPLAGQISAGSLENSTVSHLSLQSNWIFYDSKRLLWIPSPPPHESSFFQILSAHGRLALLSNGQLSIIDVSEVLNF